MTIGWQANQLPGNLFFVIITKNNSHFILAGQTKIHRSGFRVVISYLRGKPFTRIENNWVWKIHNNRMMPVGISIYDLTIMCATSNLYDKLLAKLMRVRSKGKDVCLDIHGKGFTDSRFLFRRQTEIRITKI